jgi:plastocyanin
MDLFRCHFIAKLNIRYRSFGNEAANDRFRAEREQAFDQIGEKTMKTMCKVLFINTVTVLLLAGCGGLQPQVVLSEKESEKVVQLNTESFKFKPNNIRAFEGDTILFRIENSSDSAHNFTIANPQQQILKSVDLPAKKAVDINVSFEEPGVYEFYCDKPLHSSFGMKGQVEVIKKGPGPSK